MLKQIDKIIPFDSDQYPRLQSININIDNPSRDDEGFDDCNPETNGEFACIKSLILPTDIVFDVGASKGIWSFFVLKNAPLVKLWAFEPIQELFEKLSNNLRGRNVSLHNIAISNTDGLKIFYRYGDTPESFELSTFYRRPEIEQTMNLNVTPIKVTTRRLDTFCEHNNVQNINFLKIDTEGAELDVLTGAEKLLRNKAIQIIQFEYGGTYKDSGITLQRIYDLLTQKGYLIFRITSNGLIFIPHWRNVLENYRYSNYIALIPSKKDLLILKKSNT